jgi:MFS family permease
MSRLSTDRGSGGSCHWRPVLAGSVLAVIVLIVLLGLAIVVGLAVVTPAHSPLGLRDLVRLAGFWFFIATWAAMVAGGWLAGRMTSSSPRMALLQGFLVGVVLLLLLCALIVGWLDQYGDLRSIGVELGLVELPEGARIVEPVRERYADPSIRTPEEVRATARAAVVTLITVVVLITAASGLAGLAGYAASDASNISNFSASPPGTATGPDSAVG